MAEEIVHVVINKDGSVEIKVEGIKGMSCTEITRAVEQVLGGEILDRQLTAEAYETAELDVEEQNRLRR